MELADVMDSKSIVGNNVWVRVPPSAPSTAYAGFFIANLYYETFIYATIIYK